MRLPKVRAEIVTVSHYHDGHSNVAGVTPVEDKGLVVIDRPGEYEVADVFVFGIGSYHDKKQGKELGKSVMFKFDVGGIKVLHLGDIGTVLSNLQLEKIDDVDVLLIPIGGKYTVNAKEAAEIVRQIEPRIVIPMHYKIPGLEIDLDGLDNFKKEMGNKAETVSKLKIAKKDLPVDDVKLIILEKS